MTAKTYASPVILTCALTTLRASCIPAPCDSPGRNSTYVKVNDELWLGVYESKIGYLDMCLQAPGGGTTNSLFPGIRITMDG